MMQQRNIKMVLIGILAGAILIGALACGFGDDSGDDSDSTDTVLSQIEDMKTDNLIKQQVMDARVTRLDETNKTLSDRIAKLEEDKQALTARVATLESAGPATAGASAVAPRTDLGPAYDAATPEDRQLVRTFLECTMKATGTDAALIPMLIADSEKETWNQVDAGGRSLDQIRLMHGVMCAN